MKKVMSVVLCIVFVACAVCGCSGAASQKFPQKFSFQYGGKEIVLGDNIDKAVEYLGEPEFTTDPDEYDCVLWGYNGVTIKQLDSTIISISISDSQTYQICGIHCGDSHESVVKRLQKLSDKVSDSDDSTMFTAKMSDDATIGESIDMNVPYNESIVVTADPDELWHYGEVSVMYDDNDKVEYISTSILIESTFMPSFDGLDSLDDEPTPSPTPAVTATPKPTTEPTEKPAEESSSESSKITTEQISAIQTAKSYLKYQAFSHDGLVEQLEYEGYSHEDSVFAADNCGADWNAQATACAKSYLKYQAFSYTGLIEQLEYEGFTEEQAQHGADRCEADWDEQAVACAKSYLKYQAFSHAGLVEQLEYEGFTSEQAEYGATQAEK